MFHYISRISGSRNVFTWLCRNSRRRWVLPIIWTLQSASIDAHLASRPLRICYARLEVSLESTARQTNVSSNRQSDTPVRSAPLGSRQVTVSISIFSLETSIGSTDLAEIFSFPSNPESVKLRGSIQLRKTTIDRRSSTAIATFGCLLRISADDIFQLIARARKSRTSSEVNLNRDPFPSFSGYRFSAARNFKFDLERVGFVLQKWRRRCARNIYCILLFQILLIRARHESRIKPVEQIEPTVVFLCRYWLLL